MSGRRSRRSIALQANGMAAVRVPLSGAVGTRFAGGSATPCFGKENGAPR